MSCPTKQPLMPPDNSEGDPMTLLYTLGLTAIVLAISLGYRKLWTAYWDHRIGPLGMRRIGKSGDRNLSQEFARQEGKTVRKDGSRVEALFVYPIKSTFPIEVSEGIVQSNGLEYDRQFCFAQWYEPTPKVGEQMNTEPEAEKGTTRWWMKKRHWTCLTQRQTPRLALVKTEIWIPDPQSRDYDEEDEYVKSGGCLVVKFPFTPSVDLFNIWSIFITRLVTWNWRAELISTFEVPLNPTVEQIREKGFTNERFRIFRDEPVGLNMTAEIPQKMWEQIGYTLGVSNSLALFRLNRNENRNLYKCAPTEGQLGYQAHLAFQDSYPLSIQNISSILSIESECSQQQINFTPDSRRYRGNIYLSGPPPFNEDNWALVQIGAHVYHVSCRTTRCVLPTNDADTGLITNKQPEPQKWLRANRNIDPGADAGCLGMQMVPTKEAIGAVIRIGDVVKVLKRSEHYFVADASPEAQKAVL